MNASNIQQIIEGLAVENATNYPESYEIEENAFTEEGQIAILTLAKQYFDNRTEEEIARDTYASVTLEDYAVWCGNGVAMALIEDF